jgi:hypothetical protein
MADSKIIPSSRQIIEGKLIAALDQNADQVAILATHEDLKMLIFALRRVAANMSSYDYQEKAKEWARDLEILRKGTFDR